MSTIKIDFREYGDTDAMLANIDITLRNKALAASLRKAGAPVVSKAKQLAPRSSRTGSTEKLSAKEKARRGHPAKPLADTIRAIVKTYNDGRTHVLLVGPQYPAGAHGHLNEDGHAGMEWGRPGKRKAPKPFMRPAVDQTKVEQQTAFVGELQKYMAGKP